MSKHPKTDPTTAMTEDASRPTQQRQTKQRRAIEEVLRSSSAFRSAQEIFTELRTNGAGVGLTTVYNQLRSLAEAGAVDVLHSEDREVLYRKCSQASHHHHLVCRSCGKTVEVDVPDVEQWAVRTATAEGFTDPSHTLEILGTCRGCSAKSGAS